MTREQFRIAMMQQGSADDWMDSFIDSIVRLQMTFCEPDTDVFLDMPAVKLDELIYRCTKLNKEDRKSVELRNQTGGVFG